MDAAALDAPTPRSRTLDASHDFCVWLNIIPTGTRYSAAHLILQARLPWSPQTHSLFPAEARARAVELMLIGVQLFLRGDAFAEQGAGLYDLWIDAIIPNTVRRTDYDRLRIGDYVITQRLKRQDLNGKPVDVISFNEETGRYGVRNEYHNGGRPFSVRRVNLGRRAAAVNWHGVEDVRRYTISD